MMPHMERMIFVNENGDHFVKSAPGGFYMELSDFVGEGGPAFREGDTGPLTHTSVTVGDYLKGTPLP